MSVDSQIGGNHQGTHQGEQGQVEGAENGSGRLRVDVGALTECRGKTEVLGSKASGSLYQYYK